MTSKHSQTPAAVQPLTVRISASGSVQPVQDRLNLSPKTSGILEALYVEQGDRGGAGAAHRPHAK